MVRALDPDLLGLATSQVSANAILLWVPKNRGKLLSRDTTPDEDIFPASFRPVKGIFRLQGRQTEAPNPRAVQNDLLKRINILYIKNSHIAFKNAHYVGNSLLLHYLHIHSLLDILENKPNYYRC